MKGAVTISVHRQGRIYNGYEGIRANPAFSGHPSSERHSPPSEGGSSSSKISEQASD